MTPRRSWLFTPATRPERFAKAATVGADVLLIDLEDAVAPADKSRAREAALAYLPNASGTVGLRINGLDTVAGLADVTALLESSAPLDFLMLPKADSPAHLRILDRLFTAAGRATRLIGIIESAEGLAAVDAIAASTPRLSALMFGAGDMAADLGAEVAWEPLLHARSKLVAACALARVTAFDGPFFDIRDEAGLRDEIRRSIALGFSCKSAIHPSQVAPINEALTPSAEAVARARAILAENAKGVGMVDGVMIDEAVARHARRVLAAAGE